MVYGGSSRRGAWSFYLNKVKMEGSTNNDNNTSSISVEASLQESYLKLFAKFKSFVEGNLFLLPAHAEKIKLILEKDPLLILMVMINSTAQGKDIEIRAIIDKKDWELMKRLGEKHGLLQSDFKCDRALIEKAFDFGELFLWIVDEIMKTN